MEKTVAFIRNMDEMLVMLGDWCYNGIKVTNYVKMKNNIFISPFLWNLDYLCEVIIC